MSVATPVYNYRAIGLVEFGMDDADIQPKATLEELASERFPKLSKAELQLLRAAPQGLLAHCGDSAKGSEEPANNPRYADIWSEEQGIRGGLVRWLCVEPRVQSRIDPLGIRIQSAKINGELNLSFVTVRFPLTFRSCKFTNPLRLVLADLSQLDLTTSAVSEVFTQLAHIKGSVFLSEGFSAEGEVRLYGASVGGSLDCDNGSFKNANGAALNAEGAKIEGGVLLRNEFSADGPVLLYGASVGGNLDCDHGSFKNANGDALNATLAKVERAVFLDEGFTAIGRIMLDGAAVAGDFSIAKAKLEGAYLDMQRARVGTLRGEPVTWPKAGELLLDGFSYERLAEAPIDASYRLRWLRLQRSPKTNNSFSPQPYQHLAKVLREQGNAAAAREVLIGLEDDRRKYGSLTRAQRLWAWILDWTMAYGYRPLRALSFIGIFVLVGFLVFGSAYRSEQLVPTDKDAYEKFKAGQLPGSYEGFCALVYSFDTFVPIIDLRQRSRWKLIDTKEGAFKLPKWNESNVVCALCDPMALIPWCLPLAVGFIRFFWWLDIIAGWFFTLLFAAGISGLVRRD
jgi:hypothetical protein